MLRTCGISLEWASRKIGKWAEAGTEARLANLTAEIWKLSDARLKLVWEKGTRALDCTFDQADLRQAEMGRGYAPVLAPAERVENRRGERDERQGGAASVLP